MKGWSTAESEELYQIQTWGQGFFHINERGHVVMDPPGREGSIDLKLMVDDLKRRGIELPVRVRFSDLVRERIDSMVAAFDKARAECDYTGLYRGG